MDKWKKKIVALYNRGYGTPTICEKLKEAGCTENLYPLKIARLLKKWGYDTRNLKEAQNAAVKAGTIVSPTKGKKRTDDEKYRIGSTLAEHWKKKTPDELDEISKSRKEYWNSLSDKEQELALRKMTLGRLKSAREGSNLERELAYELTRRGYRVNFHSSIFGTEVDLFLPDFGFAIEIDGRSHYYPIWGEEKLRKTQKADREKTGSLLNRGVALIRVRNEKNTFAKIDPINLADAIEEIVKLGANKNQVEHINMENL